MLPSREKKKNMFKRLYCFSKNGMIRTQWLLTQHLHISCLKDRFPKRLSPRVYGDLHASAVEWPGKERGKMLVRCFPKEEEKQRPRIEYIRVYWCILLSSFFLVLKRQCFEGVLNFRFALTSSLVDPMFFVATKLDDG